MPFKKGPKPKSFSKANHKALSLEETLVHDYLVLLHLVPISVSGYRTLPCPSPFQCIHS